MRPLEGMGQDYSSITVNEDEYTSSTSPYVPFNGQFNMDHPGFSQFIVPASDLSELQYGYIESLTFYLQKDTWGYTPMPEWDYTDQFQVYLAEVDQEVFEPFYDEETYSYHYVLYDWNLMELVYDGNVEVTEYDDCYAVKIPYLSFTYYGGNLLFGIKPYQYEHSYDCLWMGKSTYQDGGYNDGDSYSAVYSYREDWMEEDVVYGETFLPKMTIEYTPGYEPSCIKPGNLHADDIQAHGVTLSWTPRSGESQWEIAYTTNLDAYSYDSDLEYVMIDVYPYELTGLESETTYKVFVRALCNPYSWGGNTWYDYSEAASIVITTIQSSSPTNLMASNCDTPEGNTAVLEWNFGDGSDNPPYWDIAYTINLETSPDATNYITVEDCEGGYWCGDFSYQLTGLTSFVPYKAWVRANYGNGDVGEWSEHCEFMPTNLVQTTVNNCSSNDSYYVPFYTSGGSSRSQFIIPASALTELANHEIWRLYFDYNYRTFPNNTLDVYLTEVEEEEFAVAAYYDWGAMERVVHQGSIVTHDHGNCYTKGSLEFDTPYDYHGGNLLVGIIAQVSYNSNYQRFNGCATSNYPALYSTGTNDPVRINFAPKTTLYYAPESLACSSPQQLQATVGNESVVFSWTGEDGSYRIRYWSLTNPEAVEVDVPVNYYEVSLPQNTYFWEVQHLCSATDTSRYIEGPSFLSVLPTEPLCNNGIYEIYTTGELLWIEGVVNGTVTTGTSGVFPTGNTSMTGLTVKLMNDLDLSGVNWNPMGYYNSNWSQHSFNGTFDGRGHTITNLFIDRAENNGVGLFGALGSSALVCDLGVEGVSIVHGNQYVGGVAGYNAGTIRTTYCKATVNGNDYVGGLVGYSTGKMLNVYNRGNVSSQAYGGGIAGWLGGDLFNSYTTGSVSDAQGVGGPVYGSSSDANAVNNHYLGEQDYYQGGCTFHGQQYLQSQVFVNVLNAGQTPAPWKKDGQPIVNDGYPVLQYYAFPYTVSFAQPSHGTMTVTNGNIELISGSQVAANTLLTVTVTPDQGYFLLTLTANGEAVVDNSILVNEDVELVAVLVDNMVTDTAAMACDEFAWHGHTYTYSGVYYDTLSSVSGIDSIVALHLTLGHTFFQTIQEVVCDSLFWEDSLYTQSGHYERLFEAEYGCDSVLSLDLTILHDLPIGTFTYLTPMNNYVNRTEYVEFSWDAVANAKYYDLYCWNEEGERPSMPVVADIHTTTCRLNGLMNNKVYYWCIVARNDCYEIESDTRTFMSQITPSLSVVPRDVLVFEDVEIGKSKTKTLSILGVALDESIQYGFLNDAYGADSPFFQIVPSNNWDALKGGTLSVTFTPSNSQLYYSSAIWIASGSLVDTVYFEGAVANRHVFSTSVEQTIYSCDDEIVIAGHVGDVLGNAVENLDVEVYVIVMGSRMTFPTRSDDQGNYSVVYHPRKTEAGSYFVGSGVLGSQSSAVHDAFDIPGMGLVDNRFVIWEPYLNDTIQGTIGIRNRSSRPLSNIRVVPVSLPDGCEVTFSTISLGSLESGYLQYVVIGTELTAGSQYEDAVFSIVSDEGVNMGLTCFYFCRAGRGVLDVYPPNLHATVDRASQKVFSFQVTNNGNNETGVITIDVPNLEWMSVLGGNTLESLSVGDSCAFSIALFPDSDMELTSFGGTIAVNCANGNGVSVPFEIVIAESSTGTLVVDVTDDYTYNTNGGLGPHLANAQVVLTGFYSLDTVAVGLTDTEGLFVAENVPEGYYWLRVSAPDHKDFDPRVIYVEADSAKKGTNRQEVYLQFQAISYSWVVVPTEIEDVYDFELVCDIKTNVPVPVVVIEGPRQIGPMDAGDTLRFELKVKNYGLIDAYDVTLSNMIPDGYACTTLLEYIDTLPAKASVSVPCSFIKLDGNRDEDEVMSCAQWRRSVTSWWFCNHKREWERYDDVVYVKSYEQCVQFPPESNDSIGDFDINDIVTHPSGPIPFLNIAAHAGDHNGNTILVKPAGDCTPCWKVGLSALVHIAADWTSLPIADVFDCYLYEAAPMDFVYSLLPMPLNFMLMSKNLLHCQAKAVFGYVAGEGVEYAAGEVLGHSAGAMVKKLGPVLNLAQGMVSVSNRLNECISWYQPHKALDDIGDAMNRYQYCVDVAQSILDVFDNLFPEEDWKEEENIMEFYDTFLSLVDTVNYLISPQSVQQLKEACELTAVNDSMVQCFVNRWNRGVQYWNEGIYTMNDLPEGYDSLFVQMDTSLMLPLRGVAQALETYGYSSVSEMFNESVGFLLEKAVEHTNDVCAKVSVSFKQTMAMTREAFEGTLKIYNGHESDPMENIVLNMVIKDENGTHCTELFQINVNSLDQITGVDGTGTVQAQQEGVVKIVMIPTIAAAPTVPKVYSFGGSFSFLDPFSGEEMTYQLFPVQLTVNPSPELHVDYFIQRHIISDDPLTEDTIEATVPAELAMMIRNVGMGDAQNVYLESSQPEIVDNQNGLLIQFAMVGSAMNGVQRPMGLTDIPFGTIQSQTAGIAEWYFTSSLMARVIQSTPHFIHNNSFGNPDLSLVTEMHSHELIKAVRAYGSLEDDVNDFLVNETPDFNHIPDMLYFSHGGTAVVKRTLDVSTEGTLTPDHRTVLLQLNLTETGWNYALVDDPSQGLSSIVRCLRDDGQEIPLDNVWISNVTMFDDDAPIHENKLHLLDTLSELRRTTYTLEYAPDCSNPMECSLTLSIASGWNWFSSYVECNAALLNEIEDAIAANNNTALIKDMSYSTMLQNGEWSDSDLTFTNESMYMANVGNATTVALTAPRATAQAHPITLTSGWNWIGFVSAEEIEVNEALASLTPTNGDLIKNMTGASSYNGTEWQGSLENMMPGSGYMYFNKGAEMTLTYPASAKGVVRSLPVEKYWSTYVHEHATNLVLMATLDEAQFAMTNGNYEIGAFVGDECRGSARLQKTDNGYVAFLVIHGEAGETVGFRLYDADQAVELGEAEEALRYVPNAINGSVAEPVVLHFGSANVNEAICEVRVYPNPADDRVVVESRSIQTVKVYTMLGQCLLSKSGGGADQVEVRLDGLDAGIYMLKVLLDNGQQTNKRIVKE